MNRNSNQQASPFILSFIILILGAAFIIFGIMGNSSDKTYNITEAFDYGIGKGNSYEGEINYCSQCVCEYSHRLNFIIPLGTEYFYVAFSDDQSKAAVICADKDFGDNFDKDTYKALSEVKVKGKVDSMSKELKENFSEMKQELSFDFPNFDKYYIDLTIGRDNNFRIFSGIGLLISDIFVTLYFVILKLKNANDSLERYKSNTLVGFIGIVILLISILLFIYSLF